MAYRRLLRSLRVRLVLAAAVWVIGTLVVGGVWLQQVFDRHVEQQTLEGMSSDLDELAGRLDISPAGKATLSSDLPDVLFQKPLSGIYWQVTGSDGQALLRSRSLWDEVLQIPPRQDIPATDVLRRIKHGPGQRVVTAVDRVLRLPDWDKPVTVTIAWDTSVSHHLVETFTRILTASLGVLAVGLIAAVWWQVAFGLTPLKRLRRALADIQTGKTPKLDSADWPEEVRSLVEDLNSLIDHNARMVERASDAAGNLAHALKTPLAIVASEADQIAAQGEEASAATLRQSVETMRRHVDHHLGVARAQASGESRTVRTPLAPSVERLQRVLLKLHNRAIEAVWPETGAQGIDFKGDQQTLEDILGNLLENACQWTRSRVRLSIRVGVDSGRGDGGHIDTAPIQLAIEDDGPGIPEDRIAEVLRRGHRLDESKPGSGLGLAIVDSLTVALGGSLTLDRSPDLGGLRAVLRLPSALPLR